MMKASDDRGYVLISVLVLSAILALLATTILVNTRSLAISSADLRERGSARLIADAGINRAIIAYASTSDPRATPDPLKKLLKPNGQVVAWEFGGSIVHLSVQAESGKLDLNAAPLELIERLLRMEVNDVLRRERLLTRIRNARKDRLVLSSVAAILEPIERMTETLARFEALFTVHSFQAGVDGESAPEAVLKALPDLTAEQRRQLMGGAAASSFRSSFSRHLVPQKPIYTITASVRTERGLVIARQALVELIANGPPHVYAWQDTFPDFEEDAIRFSDASPPQPP